MTEDEQFDEYDEEDIDFAPLVPDASAKKQKVRLNKRESFEIVSAGTPTDAHSPVKVCCASVTAFLLVFVIGVLFIWLGISRAYATNASTEEISLLSQTCQRLNRTSNDVFDRLVDQDFCLPERPNCNCGDPFIAARQRWDGHMQKLWISTFERNKEIASYDLGSPYDVVLFGDSITEHWLGTDLNGPQEKLKLVHQVYNKYFKKDHGGKVEGLALGIGGDRTPQLLYRLQNGELPETLHSEVFWILIGTNDLGADHCSADTIVAGNIQIVEAILLLRPNSKVVINSILPRGTPGSDIFENFLWPKITTINHDLECYSTEKENVEFFNATGIFLQTNQSLTIEKYFSDPVHPSHTGHAAWAKEIVARLMEMKSRKN